LTSIAVHQKRRVHFPVVRDEALHEREIHLLDAAIQPKLSKPALRLSGAGVDDQAAGADVEAMDETQFFIRQEKPQTAQQVRKARRRSTAGR
jgi:hypothetical protein